MATNNKQYVPWSEYILGGYGKDMCANGRTAYNAAYAQEIQGKTPKQVYDSVDEAVRRIGDKHIGKLKDQLPGTAQKLFDLRDNLEGIISNKSSYTPAIIKATIAELRIVNAKIQKELKGYYPLPYAKGTGYRHYDIEWRKPRAVKK